MKELLEAAKPKPVEKTTETRTDLRKIVDASYYGYNTEEEEKELVEYEAKKEKEAYEALLKQGEWGNDPDWQPLPGDIGDGKGWVLPTLDQVQEELIERRRRRLLDQLG